MIFPGILFGLWRCRNGQFAQIDKQTEHGWTGHIIVDYILSANSIDPVPGLPRAWDQRGKSIGAGHEYDLIERKRGEEKGWPKLKES